MPAAYSTTAYRPEIQGLRTIGALLVATFHIWVGKVSGGVDVFFVVSGFLITGSLVREWERTGVIDAVGFWKRIAVRIAPMAYLVLSLTCIAGLVLMPRTALDTLGFDLLFSALHLENLRLMASAVDYLARDDAPSATQQFWALSVQVQLYAAWPILLIVAAQAAQRAAIPCGCSLSFCSHCSRGRCRTQSSKPIVSPRPHTSTRSPASGSSRSGGWWRSFCRTFDCR